MVICTVYNQIQVVAKEIDYVKLFHEMDAVVILVSPGTLPWGFEYKVGDVIFIAYFEQSRF